VKNPAGRLLGGHAFGILTDDERRELYAAALDDQELFDALAEQEPLREILADRSVRREMLDVLDRPTPGQRLWAILRRPATWADLAVAASALFLAVAGARFLWLPPVGPPGAASAPPGLLRALYDQPARKATGNELRVEGAYLAFRVERAARVLVVARTSTGALVQLFPEPGHDARVPGRLTVTVDWPFRKAGSRVRVAAFPLGVDPLSLDPARLRGLATVVEWTGPSEGGPPR
jgi:hypothetical protein